jgi:UDP-2-acetamido-2-deoxy-ribo-hexuluronate aminotransferase
MNTIQMVDLRSQYMRIREEIDHAIQGVLDTTAFINGPEVRHFADQLAKYTGASYVIPCGNGTDALQIAMMGLGFEAGQEVIVPSFTYAATVEVIALLGLKPRFVDVLSDTYDMDPTGLENALTPNVVGIVPVHLYGQCSNMDYIMQFARKHGLKVIEDGAQAIGATYTFADGSTAQAGTMGDVGTTSFFPSKNLGCYGDGGAMFTNDPLLAESLKMIASHGQKRKYYHESIGVNSRLDTLQAAILSVKLGHLTRYSASRNEVADRYDQSLASISQIKIPTRTPNSTHVFHQYTIQVSDGKRDQLKAFLQENGIPSMVYYPIPLHLQPAYTRFGYRKGEFPVAETLCNTVLSLPIHTEMDPQEQAFIIEKVKQFFAK